MCHQSIVWDLKPWFLLHMTLTVGESLNTNRAIVSGPGPPDLIHVCRSCAIPGISVRGWVGASSLVNFCLQTVQAPVTRQIQTAWNSDGISDFFKSLSLSLSLSLSRHGSRTFWLWQRVFNVISVDEGREDPNTTKSGHHLPASETSFDDPAFKEVWILGL